MGILIFLLIQHILLTPTETVATVDGPSAEYLPVYRNPGEIDLYGIVKRLEHIESRNFELETDNKRLKEEMTGLKNYMSDIQMENQEKIADLQSKIIDLQTENTEPKAQTHSKHHDSLGHGQVLQAQVGDKMTIQEKPLDDTTAPKKIWEVDHKVEQQEGSTGKGNLDSPSIAHRHHRPKTEGTSKYSADQRNPTKRAENEVDIAFYAAVGQHHIEHAGANQTIVFDDVITNVGNSYNQYAGDFRVPVDGLYVFSVTLMAFGAHTTHYSITQNGHQKGIIYLRGQDGAYATSAMTVILELKRGDDITIRNLDPDEYLYGYGYSIFSGFLLRQNYSSGVAVGK